MTGPIDMLLQDVSAFGGTGGRLLACALGNKQPVEGLRDE